MTEPRVLLDAAAFVDGQSTMALCEGTPRADVRSIAQRFLAACYDDLGKAPRLLDGDDLATVLRELLPRRFGVKDPLAMATPVVLAAYLAYLRETAYVPAAHELGAALAEHMPAFVTAVSSGEAHREGIAHPGKGETVAHQAAKVGRNDPCPCGSGRKFKKCCMRLGEA